jgi:poly-beta-1,6-N-acetyl-D-glucosamine synthase
METLFWAALVYIAYIYVGYPLVLAVWARRCATRPHNGNGGFQEHDRPCVTVIIAARDEARRLRARVENILASDYPTDRLQILIASDGSSDTTADVLAPLGPRVELLRLPPGGKAMALNAAVARARHPFLVFADARQRFAPDAIRRLVAHFADSRVGAVSGELVIEAAGSTIGDGVGAYWKYETWLRRREAIVGSTLGVTGAIYAMRRELWRPLPPETLLDDVLAPMRVVLQGRRVIFDGQARAFDDASGDAGTELRRKVRTLAGNFQLLAQEPRLVVPFVNPVWFQFMSHKIGRLLVPYALMLLFAASAALAGTTLVYAVACGVQLVFYGLAIYGALLDRRQRTVPMTPGEIYREAA